MVVVLKRGATIKQIEKLNKRLRSIALKKRMDAKKFCGTIILKESPLAIQQKLRNEWE